MNPKQNDTLIRLTFSVATARSSLKGPVSGKDYTYRDTFDLSATVLSPCGADTVLNIQSSLQISNRGNTNGSGYIATDSVSVTNPYLVLPKPKTLDRRSPGSNLPILLANVLGLERCLPAATSKKIPHSFSSLFSYTRCITANLRSFYQFPL